MSNENERLLHLLQEHKITQDEYEELSKALEKSSSFKLMDTLLLNPYQKIAGLPALLIGVGIITTISYLGSLAKIYFVGLLGVLNATVIEHPKVHPDFPFLLYQNAVIWLVLTVLFIIASKLIQRNKVRIIDFMGTVALSRFPYLLLSGFIALVKMMNPSFMDVGETGVRPPLSLLTITFSTVLITCVIWQIITYFNALKESSGLSGKKLWISFIACTLIGEIVAGIITMMPVS